MHALKSQAGSLLVNGGHIPGKREVARRIDEVSWWGVGVADGIPGCVAARTGIEWDSNVRSRLSIVYAAAAQALCRPGRASVGFLPRSIGGRLGYLAGGHEGEAPQRYADQVPKPDLDRKSTRLNSSHPN